MVGCPFRPGFWVVVSMQINGESSVLVLCVWAKGRLAVVVSGVVRKSPRGDVGVLAEELRPR